MHRNLRYCPLCIKEKYHSTLHQFTFIHQCPFHKIKLIEQCPSCNISYSYNFKDKTLKNNYTCTCGFTFAHDNRSVKSTFFPFLIDKNVKKWFNLTSSEISKINNSLLFDEEALKSDSEKAVINYDIPFVFDAINSQKSKTFIGDNQIFLDRRLVRTRLGENKFLKTEDMYENFFNKIDLEYSYQYTDKICTSVARHLRKTILKKHICCIKEFTRYEKELKNEEICPFAVAYVFWRLRLQGFKSSSDVDNWGKAPFFKQNYRFYGYPIYTYKFQNWLDLLQYDINIFPKSISSSRNTYIWIVNHIATEMFMAEFFRCLEYGLNWRESTIENYSIDSIYSFKYMPKLIITKDGNCYYITKRQNTNLSKLVRILEGNSYRCSSRAELRQRMKTKPVYVKPNPIIEIFENRYKR